MVLTVLFKFWYSLLYEEFQTLSSVTCTYIKSWKIVRHDDTEEFQVNAGLSVQHYIDSP